MKADLESTASVPGAAVPKQGRDYPTHPLWQIVLSRTREFYREPETIFWVYGFPVLMALALGIAFRNQPIETVAVAVVEGPLAQTAAQALLAAGPADASVVSDNVESGSVESDRSAAGGAVGAMRRYEVTIVDQTEARRLLRIGKVALVARPAADDKPGDAASNELRDVEYTYDPTRPESVLARSAVDDVLQRAAGRSDVVAGRDALVEEPGARYIDFLIPGLIGAGLMGGGLWGVGFVVVDMRVRNLLKRFITTPMKKSHFLAGLMLSRFAFQVTEILVMLLFAWLAFSVVMPRDWLAFLLLVALGGWTFCGIGLLVATRARTLESASGWMNLVMLPMYVLSGIFFSSERFPETVQPLIRLLPLTALIDALRAVMLEGAGLWGLGAELAVLAAWSLASFLLALKLFRWS